MTCQSIVMGLQSSARQMCIFRMEPPVVMVRSVYRCQHLLQVFHLHVCMPLVAGLFLCAQKKSVCVCLCVDECRCTHMCVCVRVCVCV